MEEVKLAISGDSDPGKVKDMLNQVFNINNVDILLASINDQEENNIEDIWILRFKTNPGQKAVLMRTFGLEEVQGYLV